MKRAFLLVLAFVLVFALCGCDSKDYEEATNLYNQGQYEAARVMFVELGDYEDSQTMVTECDYQLAMKSFNDGKYAEAITLFEALGDYQDSAEMITESHYQLALEAMDGGDYAEAIYQFEQLGDYKDSQQLLGECAYLRVEADLRGEWREYILDTTYTFFIYGIDEMSAGICYNGTRTVMNTGTYVIDLDAGLICVTYPKTGGYAEFAFEYVDGVFVLHGVSNPMEKQP